MSRSPSPSMSATCTLWAHHRHWSRYRRRSSLGPPRRRSHTRQWCRQLSRPRRYPDRHHHPCRPTWTSKAPSAVGRDVSCRPAWDRPPHRSRTRQWCRHLWRPRRYRDRHRHPYRPHEHRAPSALVAMSAAVQLGSAAPSFSYQAMVSSLPEAETMSRSPSPSRSRHERHKHHRHWSRYRPRSSSGHSAPSFSYQAMVSSVAEAETMSRSPSPSMSATWTSRAPIAHWLRYRPRSSSGSPPRRSRTRQWCVIHSSRPKRCRGRHPRPCRRHERHKHH